MSLIGQIYDAGLNAERWPHVLHLMATLFQAQQSTLRVVDTLSRTVSRGYFHNRDPHWLIAHREYFSTIDPWMKLLYQSDTPIIDCTHHVIPDREYRRMEYHCDYISRIDAHYGVGGLIDVGRSYKTYFSLKRGFNRGAYSIQHLDLIRKLVPHLNNSVLINEKTRQLELEREALSNTLSQINSAIVLVNREGRVLFANQSAETILALCDGVSLGAQGIRLAPVADQQRLQHMIARATVDVSDLTVPVAGGMKFQSQDGDCRLSILVTPLNPERVNSDLDARRCALIFLSDGQPDIGLNSEIVSEIYGLTESEAKIAAMLCQGLTVSDIAERLSISNNTIKTHLKSVFHKTHTRRQAELVNLINTGPVGIGLRKHR